MKTLLLFLLLPFAIASQNIQWQWAKNVSGTLASIGDNICAADNGNFYMINNYDTVSSISEYDGSGNKLWIKSIQGKANIMEISSSPNSFFICGSFTHTLLIENVLLTSKDSTPDAFVARYSSNGTLLWAKRIGGLNEDRGYGICSDQNGNVYVTGKYSGNPDYNGQALLDSSSVSQMFIAKIDNFGNLVFFRSGQLLYSNSSYSYGSKVAVDNSGNVYIAGGFSYFKIDTVSVTGGGGPEPAIFLIKLNSSGSVMWGKQVAAYLLAKFCDISIDSLGNIFVAAYRMGYATGNTYTQKYDANGQFVWEKNIFAQSQGNAYTNGIVNSGLETYVIGGYAYGYWSTGAVKTIIKYDVSGNAVISEIFPATFSFFNIIKDSYGDYIVCGSVSLPTKFGNDSVFPTGNKIYIAKFNEVNFISTVSHKLETKNDLVIYPNPGTGIYTVDVKNENETKIRVYNLLGDIVFTHNSLAKTNSIIDLTGYSKGVYFVEISAKGQRQTKRISYQ